MLWWQFARHCCNSPCAGLLASTGAAPILFTGGRKCGSVAQAVPMSLEHLKRKRREMKLGASRDSFQGRGLRTLSLTKLVVVAVFTMISINVHPPHDAIELEFAFNWTQRAFGALIAVVAGLIVLTGAARNDTLEQLLPLTLAALIGVFIAASNWGVAVAVGAVVSGHLNRRD